MARAHVAFRSSEPMPWHKKGKTSMSRRARSGEQARSSAAPTPPLPIVCAAGERICRECRQVQGPWLTVHGIASLTGRTVGAVRSLHAKRATNGFPSRLVGEGERGVIQARMCCVDTWLDRGGVPAC